LLTSLPGEMTSEVSMIPDGRNARTHPPRYFMINWCNCTTLC